MELLQLIPHRFIKKLKTLTFQKPCLIFSCLGYMDTEGMRQELNTYMISVGFNGNLNSTELHNEMLY